MTATQIAAEREKKDNCASWSGRKRETIFVGNTNTERESERAQRVDTEALSPVANESISEVNSDVSLAE